MVKKQELFYQRELWGMDFVRAITDSENNLKTRSLTWD